MDVRLLTPFLVDALLILAEIDIYDWYIYLYISTAIQGYDMLLAVCSLFASPLGRYVSGRYYWQKGVCCAYCRMLFSYIYIYLLLYSFRYSSWHLCGYRLSWDAMVVALSACWPSALCRQVDELLDVVNIAKSPLCVTHTYIYILWHVLRDWCQVGVAAESLVPGDSDDSLVCLL